MTASIGDALYQAAWVFYAFGPQLAICMTLGYFAASKTGGSRLNWLVAGFLAAIVPIAGALLMVWLWWRPPSAWRSGERSS